MFDGVFKWFNSLFPKFLSVYQLVLELLVNISVSVLVVVLVSSVFQTLCQKKNCLSSVSS